MVVTAKKPFSKDLSKSFLSASAFGGGACSQARKFGVKRLSFSILSHSSCVLTIHMPSSLCQATG
ncbi:hypothetical protein D3C83_175560 [compost metagenome]